MNTYSRQLIALAILLGLLHQSASAEHPVALPTLLSTNLCADLLLLRLAAPEQILALSRQSRALQNTELAEQARAYPHHRGHVEELLALKPDLVLAYAGWAGRRHGKLLARQGIDILAAPYPSDWDHALEVARMIGARIGRAKLAATLTAQADARMHEMAEKLPVKDTLYLRPNGGTAGRGTYVEDLITRLGLRNLASAQGVHGWGQLPLEHLVMTPPDLVLLGYFDQDRPLTTSGVARHPVLRRLLRAIPSLTLPANGWGCGGLELLKAAEVIVQGVRPDAE